MPITPGAAGASFDVFLAFSLDPEANRRVQEGVSSLEQELKRIQDEAAGVGKEYKKSGDEVQKTSKTTAQELRKDARAIRAEVAAMTSDVRNFQIGLLRDISSSISNISQKALITGGAIVGGIFAEVQRYVNTAPDATRETRLWAAETERLGKARSRIDAVLIREALPLLQQAGRLANQAAGIVERHPEITSLALKAGTILAGVGVIGLAVSRGIKLVADIQYLATIPTQLTAAKLQDLAADKQLAAARAQLSSAGGDVPGGGGGIGRAGLVLGGLALAGTVIAGTSKAFDALSRELISMGGIAEAVGQGIAVANHGISPFIRNLLGIGDAAKEAGDAASKASGLIRGSINEEAIVEAFSSWKEDDARLVRDAAETRKKILSDGEREIAEITRNYTNERVDINRRFNQAGAEIRNRFDEESKRAEEDYQISRAETARDGTLRLQELEEAHQERLREIRENAGDRIEEAERSRDALGLARAQQERGEAEDEEKRNFRLEQDRIRKETARRLADLDNQFAIEQARRAEQFEQDLARNEAERAEELAQAAAGFQEEQKQAREAQRQKLIELQEGLNAERLRRREVFLAQIRDLDASLLGERALRQRAYNDMLKDAEAFFNQYRASLPTASSNFGGVTGSTGKTPAASVASQIVGASIVSQGVAGLIPQGATSANYYDNRRMQVPLSTESKRAYVEGAKDALRQVIGVR